MVLRPGDPRNLKEKKVMNGTVDRIVIVSLNRHRKEDSARPVQIEDIEMKEEKDVVDLWRKRDIIMGTGKTIGLRAIRPQAAVSLGQDFKAEIDLEGLAEAFPDKTEGESKMASLTRIEERMEEKGVMEKTNLEPPTLDKKAIEEEKEEEEDSVANVLPPITDRAFVTVILNLAQPVAASVRKEECFCSILQIFACLTKIQDTKVQNVITSTEPSGVQPEKEKK